MIAENINFPVAGSLTFWSGGAYTELKAFTDGLTELGFADCAPEPRTPLAALKDALTKVFKGSEFAVDAFKGRDGYQVSRIDRTRDYVTYDVRLSVKVAEGSNQLKFSPYDSKAGEIVDAYNEQLGLVVTAQVTGALVKVVRRIQGLFHLKPGLYWIPAHQIDVWSHVADVVRKASHGAVTKVTLARHCWDPDTLAMVRDAIAEEVKQEADRIYNDITKGELGERGVEHRRQQAEDLRRKVILYEEVVGASLPWLHKQVDKAEQAEAMAALQIAAGTEVA